MKKLLGLSLGIPLMAGLILTSAACAPASGDTGKGQSASLVNDLVRNSSTFKFDGYADSVRVSTPVEKADGTLEYTVEYTCGQPGHGDRSGQMLAQLVTNHTATVDVKDGKVTSAVCDGEWNMTADKNLTDPSGMTMPEGQNVTVPDAAGMTMPAWDNTNRLPAPDNAAK